MPTVALAPVEVIAGRYEVKAPLGEGGMGAVFRVLDRELDEEVALKVLHSDLANTPEALHRFRREVKLARRVTHPNVARTYDLGLDESRRFITMELLRGESLAKSAREGVALGEALRVAAGVARGLAAAHAEGVVHRDLKPENVMLCGERVVITDFGIARAERAAPGEREAHATVAVIGTPAYMSPEQVEGLAGDGRSDVYALGVVLFELLTKRLPFEGETAIAVATARLLRDAPDPRTFVEVPDGVADLIMRTLSRRREERPDAQTMVDAIDELRGLGGASDGAFRGPGFGLGSEAFAELGQQSSTLESRDVRVAPFDGGATHAALAADLTRAVEDAVATDKSIRLVRGNLPFPDSRTSSAGVSAPPVARITRGDGRTVSSGDLGAPPAMRPSTIPEAPPSGAGASSLTPRSLASRAQVIEGTVRVSGPNARVRVRLLDTNGAVMDVDRIDAPAADGFDLEDLVADRSLALVRKRFTAGRRGPAGPLAPRFERAREHYERFDLGNLLIALRELEMLHAEAPDDAYITSLLANALVRRWAQEGATEAALLARAEDLTLRALDADTDIPDAYYAMASVRQAQGDVFGCFRAALEAQRRGPRFYEAHHIIGSILFEVGHIADGLRRIELAARLGPKAVVVQMRLANAVALMGDRTRSEEILLRVREEAGPLSTVVAELDSAAWYGDQKYALDLAERVMGAPAGASWRRSEPILRAFADGSLDKPQTREAFRSMTTDRTAPTRRAAMHRVAADFLARLEMYDDALDHLTKVSQMPVMIYLTWLDKSPSLDPVRAEPKFAEARAKVAARVASMGF
ncbi:MAG: protein kinase [Polyangiaceae bacterium]|nr:protein kinase [Polyangiaceae bacterium]